MREYKQKKKIRNRVFSKVSIIILFLVFLLLVKASWSVYVKSTESASNLARVNNSIFEATKRQDSLKKETMRLNTTEGIEDEIRHKYQVTKEGERVIVVVDDSSNESATSTDASLLSKMKHAIVNFIR